MQIETGFADVNGTRFYYEIAGSGHPLVLIHGNTLDTRMWDDQFEVFVQQYRVLRYDVRGFGKSAVPTTEPYWLFRTSILASIGAVLRSIPHESSSF
jgi:3-oxoadipate enol-lactonase